MSELCDGLEIAIPSMLRRRSPVRNPARSAGLPGSTDSSSNVVRLYLSPDPTVLTRLAHTRTVRTRKNSRSAIAPSSAASVPRLVPRSPGCANLFSPSLLAHVLALISPPPYFEHCLPRHPSRWTGGVEPEYC